MKYREFAKLFPGEEAVMDVDLCVLNDNLSMKTLETIRGMQAFDKTKIIIIIDQIVPPNSAEHSGKQRQLMKLSEEQQIPICFGQGMTSHYLCDGRVGKGQVVAAVNPAVAAAGAVGAYGINVDEETVAAIFEKGQLKVTAWQKVEINLTGVLAERCTSKDVALTVIGRLGTGTQKDKILSVSGEGLERFAVEDKIDLNILLSETGAAAVICSEAAEAPENAVDIVLDEISEQAAVNNSYDMIENLSEMKPEKINVVYIGGSTGGNFRDMKIAADTVRGKQIAYGVRLAAAPATSEIYKQMADAGFIQDILDAGGLVLNQCADAEIQCRIGNRETMVSSDWKNTAGYAGYETSQVIIASTKSAVNAALCGVIGGGTANAEEQEPSFVLKGRCWKFGDDIDTDIIIPTQYVCIPYEEMLHYAFAPLRPEMADQIEDGDIIVAGENFGCGSSREMAAEVIAGNGIRCIIAKSFARIFFRNAINNGILLIECPELPDETEEGDIVKVELNQQIICNGKSYPIGKIKDNLYEIIADGGLVKNIEKKVKLGLL